MIIVSMFYKHKEGGFNKRLYRMYRALVRAGHEVHYLACEPFPIEHDHIHYHRLRVPFAGDENLLFWLLFCIIAPIRALSVARRVRAERVAVFGASYALFTCLPRVLFGCRLLTFLRADSVVLYRNEKRSLQIRCCNYVLEYLGLFMADRIWTNIGMVRTNIIKRYRLTPEKVGIIYNNIDAINEPDDRHRAMVRKTLGLDTTAFVIATSGIFYKRKNIGFLIKAFHEAALIPRAVLLVIGDDVGQANERRQLERLVRDLGIDRQVIFTGWRKDSPALIGASDLFVLPTLHEGFPNSLLDAMAVGCPCLGSRIQEIVEVLEDDDLLFSLDSQDELAQKLHRAAEDPAYVAHLARLTRERARKFCFDWDASIVSLISAEPSFRTASRQQRR
jgi:glycosyltransferase involved in cell wall biosynthesis